MAIKRFSSYETTKAYTDYQALPKGGYVLKIMGASVHENTYGQYIQISCDVAEGEYKDFFANDYRAQQGEDKKWHCNYLLNVPNDDGSERDGWTARRFKTVIEALEASNSGYHFDWDETKFKGKLIGGLFNIREYRKNNGDVGESTNLAQLCEVKKIRDGKYKVPADKRLDEQGGTARKTAQAGDDGFMNIPEVLESELPF